MARIKKLSSKRYPSFYADSVAQETMMTSSKGRRPKRAPTSASRARMTTARGTSKVPQSEAPVVRSASRQRIGTHLKAKTIRAERRDGATALSANERRGLIAQAAYFRAERRGFAPGHELEDWVAAELEVDQFLAASTPSRPRRRLEPQGAVADDAS